ncbi:hypothetical protein Pcinc_007477 [Petrolisthes cinctipes]|uniref:Uncharacterized protein n=1 Tax=Petrolisthes cinctipes TaxID=88211 RepID=A0AAE1G8F4_PETCI|nr:hypothetical protein Pcinc_007477 [Petrolisthes cinctipes]
MSDKLSRSWSFFSGRRGSQNNNSDCLNQHYHQPPPPPGTAAAGGTPPIRVNLQQRFTQQEQKEGTSSSRRGGWRKGPLPSPPTHQHHGDTSDSPAPQVTNGQTTYTQAEGHHSFYIHPDEDPTAPHSDPPQPHPQRPACSRSQHNSPGASSRLPRRPLRRLPSGVAPLWNNLHDNWSQFKPSTSKVFSEGGKKVNRALQGVRTSLTSLTQMFRSSTRRRYKLDGGTPNRTPGGRTPRRTPGKLYSPFNMNTPVTPYSHRAPKRLQQSSVPRRNMYGNENRGLVRTPQHCPPQAPQPFSCSQPQPWPQFDSPSRQLEQDVKSMRQGMRDLERVSTSILHQPGHHTWTQFR